MSRLVAADDAELSSDTFVTCSLETLMLRRYVASTEFAVEFPVARKGPAETMVDINPNTHNRTTHRPTFIFTHSFWMKNA